jgi:hypothetical protein
LFEGFGSDGPHSSSDRFEAANQPGEIASLRPQVASALGIGDRRPDRVVRFRRGPKMNRLRGLSVRKRATAVLARADNEPHQTGMPRPAEQVDHSDRPRKLFVMRTRMFGLPVAVLRVQRGRRIGGLPLERLRGLWKDRSLTTLRRRGLRLQTLVLKQIHFDSQA